MLGVIHHNLDDDRDQLAEQIRAIANPCTAHCTVPGVSADVKLTRVAEVKLTHLGEDGGFGTAYVDPGAVRGDSGVVLAGEEN